LTSELKIDEDEDCIDFLNDFDSHVSADSSFEELNEAFTLDEIRSAIKLLGRDKACSLDNISYEYFLEGIDVLDKPLEILFNYILDKQCFPKSWSKGVIIPVFKKGDNADVNNYREMQQSHWPDGPYWLLMSVNGCPEPPEFGWEIGYIQFTANISEHETAFFHESQIESKVSGMFGPYTYRMNFCYKSDGQFESFEAWPNFYFSVFGTKDSCPGDDFTESVLNVTVVPIINVMSDGAVPDFKIVNREDYTDIEFVICEHKRVPFYVSNWRSKSEPFIFIKFSSAKCPRLHGTAITFPLPSTTIELELCFFRPVMKGNRYLDNSYQELILYDWNYYAYIPCHAVFHRKITVDIGECMMGEVIRIANVFEEFTDCVGLSFIYIDLLKTVRVSGVMFDLDWFSDKGTTFQQIKRLIMDSHIQIFIGNVPWNNMNKFNQRCRHVSYTQGYGRNSGVVILTCSRDYKGRYITIQLWKHTGIAEMIDKFRVQTSTLNIYAVSCTDIEDDETALPCNEELGMASYAIQDFQISATSTYGAYVPINARPGGTGWQALKSDVLPFIQVDLLVHTIVNGIVVYNWYEVTNDTSDNLYRLYVNEKGCPSFRLQYGTSLQHMRWYKFEVSYFHQNHI
ncbi:uncharacterized protein LOC132758469, partial [Ruditapes philippinarum]|uniref:uncharacterized protein LOC132758469 n=2 Tax=Ruditapes philippinarum TaxID=129788 RepID=UPI00295BA1BA